MEKVTLFFPLHPVTFYEEYFEKQKCLELVPVPSVARHAYKKRREKNNETLNK